MPSYGCEVKIDRRKLQRCRLGAEKSVVGFVCGPWKLRAVIDRRMWKIYRNEK